MAATARSRSTLSSISGSLTLASTHTHTTASTRPPPISPMVRGEPQPQVSAWVTPSSSDASAPDSSTAPGQSIRGRWVLGWEGMSRYAAAAAGSATRLIQNSQEMSEWSTMTPDSGSPIPPPMPKTALSVARCVGTLSGGEVSRTMPNASGNTPPATPCSTRPATSTSIVGASALMTPPTAKMTSTTVSTRPRP